MCVYLYVNDHRVRACVYFGVLTVASKTVRDFVTRQARPDRPNTPHNSEIVSEFSAFCMCACGVHCETKLIP